ncbi:MAG: YD repeat-containing protein, partial [Arenicella sp.]
METIFAYSGELLESITDPASRATTFVYDDNGNIAQVTFPDQTSKTFGYDHRHLMTTEVDERGHKYERFYDDSGRYTRGIRPDGAIHNVTNQVSSSLNSGSESSPSPVVRRDKFKATFSDGNNNTRSSKTDKFGRLIESTDANDLVTTTDRDKDGNAIRTVRPDLSEVTRVFDDNGNVLTRTESFNGAVSTYTYDPLFNLMLSQTDARGHTMTYVRDERGNVIESVNHLGHTALFTYLDSGLIETTTSPNGLVTEYQYNSLQLLETLTETPSTDGGVVRISSFEYFDSGLAKTVTTPDGIIYQFTYDERSRLRTVTDNLGQEFETIYDTYGNVSGTNTKSSAGDIVLELENFYDELHRLDATKAPHKEGALSESFVEYDLDGNVIESLDPNVQLTKNIYDPGNRLDQIENAENGVTDFDYDANNNVQSIKSPNGATTTFEYDSLSRLSLEQSPDRGDTRYAY